MWNLDPPPDFQGLRDDLPLTVYQRHLPHWQQPGATYFVTFRLADSLPQEKLRELQDFRSRWLAQEHSLKPKRGPEELAKEVMERVERWLDQGMGECVLRAERCAGEVASAMKFFDGQRYELGCFVVMPNHVHAIVRPYSTDVDALETILHSWKRHSSAQINAHLGAAGALWQEESFDRIIRDPEHLYRCIQYIARNPEVARLTDGKRRRWISPVWESLGWRFDVD
jgi:putative transposase